MYTLPTPDRDSIYDYDEIVANRSRNAQTTLQEARDVVETAYSDYLSKTGNGKELQPILPVPAVAGELKNNFRCLDRGRSHEFLRDQILSSASLGLCPYCSATMVDSLDHVLPLNTYPEFAVLVQNLVPSCNKCNRLKHDTCFHKNGINLFHPYYVEVPTDPFLFADINVETKGVAWEFYLRRPSSLDEHCFGDLANLFTQLKLADLYAQHAAVEVISRLDSMDGSYESGGAEDLRDYLLNESESAHAFAGSNYWKTVILRSLADSDAFCEGGYKRLSGG